MKKLMKRVPRRYGSRQGGGVYAYEFWNQFVNCDRYMAGNGQPWTVPQYQMNVGQTARDVAAAVGVGRVEVARANSALGETTVTYSRPGPKVQVTSDSVIITNSTAIPGGLGSVEVRQAIPR